MCMSVATADLQDHDVEVQVMGEVAVVIKVMPTGVDVDLETLKNNLKSVVPKGIELQGINEEPVAFGLVALMVTIVVGDVEGGTDSVEEAFSQVADVESVQVAEIGRLL